MSASENSQRAANRVKKHLDVTLGMRNSDRTVIRRDIFVDALLSFGVLDMIPKCIFWLKYWFEANRHARNRNNTNSVQAPSLATNSNLLKKKTMAHFKITTALLAISALLSACGGSSSPEDNQQITSVTVRALAYSRQAVLFVSGTYLRANMTAVTGVCKDPIFNMSQSTPELAVLNCTVTATGDQPLTITGTNGKVLYTGAFTVPQPQIELVTSQGSMVVELNPAAAPVSVNNFLSYANGSFYNNTLFHRVIAGFVVQGGGYTKGLVKKADQLAPIVLESNNGLFNTRGTLAMARTNVPNSATSEFYVNLVDNRSLDYQSPANPGYAVFGRVVNGLEVIDKIAALRTATVNGFADVPVTDVTLQLALQIK